MKTLINQTTKLLRNRCCAAVNVGEVCIELKWQCIDW